MYEEGWGFSIRVLEATLVQLPLSMINEQTFAPMVHLM